MKRMTVRKNTAKRNTNKWTISSLLVLVILLSGGIYYYSTTQTNNEENVIETSTIDTGNIILSATGLGTLIPSEEVSFGFKNGGEVSEVLVSWETRWKQVSYWRASKAGRLNCNTNKRKQTLKH